MIDLSPKQIELIEHFGVVQEKMGLAPATSRVNALLTISDKTELTFDEIREALQLSKSSASNAINNLLSLDRIGYKTKLGDRKRYFYSRLDHWRASFRKDILGLNDYTSSLSKILENRTKDTEVYNDKLEELVNFMDYFIDESIQLIDKWENKN